VQQTALLCFRDVHVDYLSLFSFVAATGCAQTLDCIDPDVATTTPPPSTPTPAPAPAPPSAPSPSPSPTGLLPPPYRTEPFVIEDVNAPFTIEFEGGSLVLPAGALSEPTTVIISIYLLADLQDPPYSDTLAPSRRSALSDSAVERRDGHPGTRRIAGNMIGLAPEGLKLNNGAVLTLPCRVAKAESEMYEVNRLEFPTNSTAKWTPIRPSKEIGTNAVSATITVLSNYAPLVGPRPPTSGGEDLAGLAALVIIPLGVLAVYLYRKAQQEQQSKASTQSKGEFTGALVPSTNQQVTGMQAGWSSCKGCGNPVKETWPRCPGCKTPVSSAGRAAPAQSQALTKSEFQPCTGCGNPVKASWKRCPSCHTGVAGGTSAAALPASAPGAALATPPPGWVSCPGCTKPIKATWPRCPGCQHVLQKDKAATPAPVRTAQPSTVQPPAAGVKQPGWKECPGCKKPVRESWPKCPACQAPIKGGAPAAKASVEASVVSVQQPKNLGSAASDLMKASGFDATCANPVCGAPVKRVWKRCPSCKTPIVK